jgi:putative aldouronate transport system substrate-binding protein
LTGGGSVASSGTTWSVYNRQIDTFSGAGYLVGVSTTDTNLKAFNVYNTQDYMTAVKLRWSWQQKGFYTKDPLPAGQGISMVQAGKYAMLSGQQAKPNDIPTIENTYGQKFKVMLLGTPFMATDSIIQNMNSIARTSKHPGKVLQWMNLVNTDATIFNMLAHGIEGKHWEFKDKANNLIGFPTGVTSATSGYNPSSDWMFGNEQNGYYTDVNSEGVFAKIQTTNAAAARSVAFGFAFDPTNVKTELAQVATLVTAMTNLFDAGQLNPNAVAGYVKQINDAGGTTIVAEVQKQLNAWKK